MPRFGPLLRLIAVVGAVAWTAGCGDSTPPPEPNKYPRVTELIPSQKIFIGDTVVEDLSEHFTDPDGDVLTYEATSSDPAIVAVSVTGSTLRIMAVAKGQVTVKVTATDEGGLSAEMDVKVTVGNRAPIIVDTIANVETYAGEGLEYALSDHFTDLDGDPLTYAASSSNEAVVVVHLSADNVEVEAVGRGDATMTFTATDSDSAKTHMVIPTVVTPIPERVVLGLLWDAAGGSNWKRDDNWGSDADLATWYGVEVNADGEVRSLSLADNNLEGVIAPQLGDLAALDHLNLASNKLTGEVPVSFSRLPLSELHFTNNPGLGGELSTDFHANLRGVNSLFAGGTDICAPNERLFRQWLRGIPSRRVRMCKREDAAAYLVQATQAITDSDRVALVGGKEALLRVFPTSSHSAHEGLPPVRARFYVDGEEVHTVTTTYDTSTAIPVNVDEGSLRKSVNVKIPGEVLKPDLELMVEIDPGGTLDEELGVSARIRDEYRVYDLPVFKLTVIPFLYEPDPDSAILDYVEEMEEKKQNYSLLHSTYDLLPVDSFVVTAYEAVETSTEVARELLSETDAIRRSERTGGYFQGQMSGRANPVAGIAYLGGRASYSNPSNLVISHELAHNMDLRHAPCGNPAGVDPNFPHDDGTIGNWGYDFRRERTLDPDTYDLLSYCNPQWISGYGFDKATRYRRAREYRGQHGPSGAVQTLLVWGGLDEDGKPFLDPAFVMEAFPGMPAFPGPYALTGRSGDGTELFSLSFDMPQVADAPGKSSSFVFTLPVQTGWSSLASITLSGPEGSFTLDGDADDAMTIAREGIGGKIRAFWDGWREPRADRPELVLLRSRGIPGRAEWER